MPRAFPLDNRKPDVRLVKYIRKLYKLCFFKSHYQAHPSLRKMYYCPRGDFTQRAKKRGGILVTRAYYRNILTVEIYSQAVIIRVCIQCETGGVTLHFKGGSPTDCDNYRPISVLPCISKIMESFVNTDLKRNFAHEVGLIKQHQFAYSKFFFNNYGIAQSSRLMEVCY